jgi:hypothetical protein
MQQGTPVYLPIRPGTPTAQSGWPEIPDFPVKFLFKP